MSRASQGSEYSSRESKALCSEAPKAGQEQARKSNGPPQPIQNRRSYGEVGQVVKKCPEPQCAAEGRETGSVSPHLGGGGAMKEEVMGKMRGGGDSPARLDLGWTADQVDPESYSSEATDSNDSRGSVKVQSPTLSQGTPTMDLMQFSQWMAKHQAQLLRDVTQQQQQAQAPMMQDLQQALLTVGQATTGVGAGHPPVKSPWLSLTKMSLNDDVEAFILGPYLAREVQATMKALEKADAANYGKPMAAILDRYKITHEAYHQRFCSLLLLPSGRPCATIAALCDATTQWLNPISEDG
ncbi:UNVERIFIED_CONTAM: hypothetical protein K2H54_062063 [Gekko kuhli]